MQQSMHDLNFAFGCLVLKYRYNNFVDSIFLFSFVPVAGGSFPRQITYR